MQKIWQNCIWNNSTISGQKKGVNVKCENNGWILWNFTKNHFLKILLHFLFNQTVDWVNIMQKLCQNYFWKILAIFSQIRGKTKIIILATLFFKRLYIWSEDNSAKNVFRQISKHTSLSQTIFRSVG